LRQGGWDYAWNAACIGTKRITVIFWESQRETGQEENLDIGGMIILKWGLEKYDRVLLTGLFWLRAGTSGRPL
jgi:hypothetical protein